MPQAVVPMVVVILVASEVVSSEVCVFLESDNCPIVQSSFLGLFLSHVRLYCVVIFDVDTPQLDALVEYSPC